MKRNVAQNLPDGIKEALLVDVSKELDGIPREDFICKGKLRRRLIRIGIVNEGEIINRKMLESIKECLL